MNRPAFDKKQFFRGFIFWFIAFSIIFWFLRPDPNQSTDIDNSVPVLSSKNKDEVLGNIMKFSLENKTTTTWRITGEKDTDPLRVFRVVNNNSILISEDFEGKLGTDLIDISLIPETKKEFDFKSAQSSFFSESGKYQIELDMINESNETMVIRSNIFQYENPGIFRSIFRALVSKPIFNSLVFIISLLPGHEIGWAIIILTIIIRLLLFSPNQKAMKSQRAMQSLQPKIDELRKKYAKNQQTMAMKTMELYRSNNIHPLGSILPILIQMPILIGLYFVIVDGIGRHSSHLLYQIFNESHLINISQQFFGLDLSVPNIFLLPFLVGGAQWIAIFLSRAHTKNTIKGAMKNVQNIMQWGLPVLIGFLTATFPSGVGIYWLTSTVFGIGQQYIINRESAGVVHKKID